MKTIVWDVDDVLNDLTREWFEKEWLVTHPECNISYTQLKSNPPNELLNIDVQDYLRSLDHYRLLYGSKLKPVDEVYSWFKRYGQMYRNIVLTSTPLFYAPYSSEWVLRNFGAWIRSFNFLPSLREESEIFNYDMNKASYLKLFDKVDLFIDDNEKNILEARSIGINCITMPRPWNSDTSTIKEFLYNLITNHL
jgi:FMN phosphatase YigB (HAD superfamily)